MEIVLRDLLKNLEKIETKGKDNLARLYNSIDIVEQLISGFQNPKSEEIQEVNPSVEGTPS